MLRNKVHETTSPDSTIMDDGGNEHYYDEQSQELISSITGTMEPPSPHREGEVREMYDEQFSMQEAVKQLALVLSLSGKHVARVIQGSSQIRTSTISVPTAFTPVQFCAKNVERSRLLLSPVAATGAGNGYVVISADPNVNAFNFNPTIGAFPNNAFVARVFGKDVSIAAPFIELRTVENMWVTSDIVMMLGIVEEWVS